VTRGRISTPKNGKTRRVDMSLQLTETFKAHMTASKIKGFALGLGAMPDYVFTNGLIPTTGEARCSESPRVTISRMCQTSWDTTL
jgi:hypothetical protein